MSLRALLDDGSFAGRPVLPAEPCRVCIRLSYPCGGTSCAAPLPACRICMSACDEGDTLCGGYHCWSKDEPELRK